jgi:hypothetical protein
MMNLIFFYALALENKWWLQTDWVTPNQVWFLGDMWVLKGVLLLLCYFRNKSTQGILREPAEGFKTLCAVTSINKWFQRLGWMSLDSTNFKNYWTRMTNRPFVWSLIFSRMLAGGKKKAGIWRGNVGVVKEVESTVCDHMDRSNNIEI